MRIILQGRDTIYTDFAIPNFVFPSGILGAGVQLYGRCRLHSTQFLATEIPHNLLSLITLSCMSIVA